MGEFALGQPVARFEDPRLLRGGGRYVDDMVLPHMVRPCAALAACPSAHPLSATRICSYALYSSR
jgi:aerobic carbon-monoxide dehydrogenase large subunit